MVHIIVTWQNLRVKKGKKSQDDQGIAVKGREELEIEE